MKTLKTLETGQNKGSLCGYEDSDEEQERLIKEAEESRIAEFHPQIEFGSKALTRDEAVFLVEEIRIPFLKAEQLTEPIDKDSVLLHNEASDSSRINNLQFQVLKVEINGD